MPAALAPLQLLAWLLTYLVHSTLLLALAWLATRRRGALSLASRERLWKLAVAGGFLTATLQLGLGLEPPLGRLALASEPSPVAVLAEPSAAQRADEPLGVASRDPAPDLAARLDVFLDRRGPSLPRAPRPGVPAGLGSNRPSPSASPVLDAQVAWPLTAGLELARAVSAPPRPQAEPPARSEPEPSVARARPERTGSAGRAAFVPVALSRAALAGWSLAALACALLFALGLRRLRRDLRGRVELVEGPLVDELEHLRLRAGVARRVRLYVAPRVAAPLSMGWVRPAICVPPRALVELEPDERTAMLAHEVAHLARRDPLWLFVLWLVETAFFFQPLNRLARRELAALFELSADGWAARATGQRLALASCLARIAGWIVGEPPPRAHRAWTAAMADALEARRPRSRLGERIERLCAEQPARARRADAPLALALLATLAFVAPGAAASRASAPDALGQPPVEPVPAAAARTARSSSGRAVQPAASVARLDTELEALERELAALREELGASELAQRFAPVLDELALRIVRLGERRRRVQALLEQVRSLEAAAPVAPSIGWQESEHPPRKER